MKNNLADLNNHLFAILNHQKLRSESAEQTETAVILAKLKHKIQQKKAQRRGEKKCR